MTLAELRTKLKERRDRHALALLQAPADHAQKKTAHAAEQQRSDVKVARTAWFDGQLDLDPEKLIFIDETGTTTKMARLYGRAPRGERCRAAIPHGHSKRPAGLRIGGLAARKAPHFPTAQLGRVLINRQPSVDLDALPNVRYWG